MTDIPDLQEFRQKVRRRVIAAWMSEGSTEQEAVDRFQRAMDAPWPASWPKPPTVVSGNAYPDP